MMPSEFEEITMHSPGLPTEHISQKLYRKIEFLYLDESPYAIPNEQKKNFCKRVFGKNNNAYEISFKTAKEILKRCASLSKESFDEQSFLEYADQIITQTVFDAVDDSEEEKKDEIADELDIFIRDNLTEDEIIAIYKKGGKRR